MFKVVLINFDMFNKQLTCAFLCFQNKNCKTSLKDLSKKTLVEKAKGKLKKCKITLWGMISAPKEKPQSLGGGSLL